MRVSTAPARGRNYGALLDCRLAWWRAEQCCYEWIACHRAAIDADGIVGVIGQDVEVTTAASHVLLAQARTLLAWGDAFALWLADRCQERLDAVWVWRNLVHGLAQIGSGAFDVAGQLDHAGFAQIAARYQGDASAPARLAGKIREGGVGAWGRVIMPRQPKMTVAESETLARWVLAQPPQP